MPTPGRDENGKRNLSLGLILSVLLHATILPLILWLALLHSPLKIVPPPAQNPDQLVIESSAVRVDQKPKPQPRSVSKPVPIPAHRPVQTVIRPQPPPRHELAVLTPKAPPQPRFRPKAPSFSDQLAAQQAQFAQTAARLHSENNPLSVASSAPVPSTLHRAYMDSQGQQQEQNRFWALLVPTQHWVHGDQSCYYTKYTTQFGNGGSEEGTIPWPLCYPRDADKMLPLDRPHELPVPVPPVGWKLPADDYLTPWLEDIYDERSR